MKAKIIFNSSIALSVLFIAFASVQCSSTMELSCNCKEESLEIWTSEFITGMNAGHLPQDADKSAEAKSALAYKQCMDENLKNITLY